MLPDTYIESEQHYFCYMVIFIDIQAFFSSVLVLLNAIFLIRTFIIYIRLRKSGRMNPNINKIFLIMLSLTASYMLKMIISQCLFWFEYSYPFGYDYSSYNTILSKYAFVSEIVEQLLFQIMLLMVSYNWVGNIIQVIDYMLGQGQSDRYAAKQKTWIRNIKICMGVSWLQLIIIILLFSFQEMEEIVTVCFVCFGFRNLVEVSVAVIFIVDRHLIRVNKKLKQILDQQGRNSMYKKYTNIAWLIIFRLVLSIVMTIIISGDSSYDQPSFYNISCKIGSSKQIQWPNYDEYVMLSYAHNVLLLLIIFVIWRVYQIEPQVSAQQRQNENTIIISTNQ